jgi:outer membrane protein TolC
MMRKQTNYVCGARRLAVLCTASVLAAASPITALAAKNTPNDQAYQAPEAPAPDYKKDISPEFAYSQDKWASLRDNVMEYEELADLVHEYNPTVRSNRYNYSDQKNQNLSDIYEELMEDAQDAWDLAASYDTDTYSGRLSSAQYDFSGNSLAKIADNNYVDAEMYKIQYDQTEANLVFQAQQLMISLEQSAASMEELEANRSLAQTSYEAVQVQQSVGMATEINVLTSLKSVQDLDSSILSLQKSINNIHRNLCLMLGWSADAEPDIRPVPEADLTRIDAMDPNADQEEALANNYDVKYYQRKLENVASDELRAATQASIDNAKDTVVNNLNTQYNTVLNARDALETANIKLQLETVNLDKVHVEESSGNAGILTVQQQEAAYTSAKNAVETSKLELLLAMEKYDWIKKGLTFQS